MESEKEKRRKRIRELNEPPQLTTLEETGNAVTHGIGAVLALVGFILLLLKSDTGLKIMASCFYGISLFLLMLMSCLYHAFKSGSTVKRLWRRFDYASIYLLIGGTFAPLYLVYWGNTLGIIIFCIQWALILLGIVMLSIFGPGRLKWLHFSLYFVIGWSGLIFIPDWIQNNMPLLWFILIGGVIYTVGMVPFTRDKKYDHFLWHFFVVAGAILHWFGIYMFVY
ncbi:MAG: hemolysin III family protein [Clostridium sp.]|uniref:PAQR family membrane homeostasis protein TrhA n=1 Tax=Clostridium sp. TaxID=1506 RepID=UPI002A8BD44C|nr:hemolysin III family protein [Clostridium sp.]MDY5099699.1 hemolysin III family protein [Clostridium sp.]